MSITRICGVPGSGKTTLLAYIASRAVRRPNRSIRLCGQLVSEPHDTVITNFEFPGAYKLDFDVLGKGAIKDALVLIDEAALLFNARDYKQFSHFLQWWFRMSRHMSLDIVIASQQVADVDKVVRDLTVNLYRVNRLPFGLFRLDYLEPFFDIFNYQPVSGYDWGRWQIINGRSVYHLFDTHDLMGRQLVDVKLEPWALDSPKSSDALVR